VFPFAPIYVLLQTRGKISDVLITEHFKFAITALTLEQQHSPVAVK